MQLNFDEAKLSSFITKTLAKLTRTDYLIVMPLIAVIEKDRHGFYAHCPQLQGCQSQGRTLEEALKNIKEAAELYMETMSAKDRKSLNNRMVFTTPIALA